MERLSAIKVQLELEIFLHFLNFLTNFKSLNLCFGQENEDLVI